MQLHRLLTSVRRPRSVEHGRVEDEEMIEVVVVVELDMEPAIALGGPAAVGPLEAAGIEQQPFEHVESFEPAGLVGLVGLVGRVEPFEQQVEQQPEHL